MSDDSDFCDDELLPVRANNESHVPDVRLEATRYDKLWIESYRKLEAFQKANGHCNAPKPFEDGSLHVWVVKQRHRQKTGTLRNDRKQLLNDLGFSWKIENKITPATDDDPWMTKYNQLVDLKKKNKHRNVCLQDNELRKWFRNQKDRHRRGRLPKDRQQLLDQVGHVSYQPKKELNTLSAPPEAAPSSTSIGQTKPEAVPSSNSIAAQVTAKKDLKFSTGTRIEKQFDVDGTFQTFGGNVTAFEYLDVAEGTQTCGYLIDYDDGDQEHMLEADVAKNLVVVKKMKRAAKGLAKLTAAKRVKK